jgi:hypothetical protein
MRRKDCNGQVTEEFKNGAYNDSEAGAVKTKSWTAWG